jgi:hypothetical protein
MLINCQEILKFLERSVNYYENSAPTVSRCCEHLYRRVNEARPVQLLELINIQRLAKDDGGWIDPSDAENLIARQWKR